MNFFFDNNLSPNLARALHKLAEAEKHSVVHLIDKYAPNATDTYWMGELAKESDWYIVTADVRIGRNVHEVRAWKEAGHTVFFLKPGWLNCGFWVQAWKFTKCFPDIVSAAEAAQKGSGFVVSVNGKIEKLN